MANIIFLDNTASRYAYIESSSEKAGAPGSNLLIEHPSHRWESNTLAGPDPYFDIQLSVDGSEDAGYDAVYLGFFNVQPSGGFYVDLANFQQDLSPNPSYSSGLVSWHQQTGLSYAYGDVSTWYRFPTRRTETWMKIAISDDTNPDTVLRGSVIHVGKIHEPQIPMSFGSRLGYVDPSVIKHADAGNTIVRSFPGWDEGSIPMRFANEDDALMFYALARRFGKRHAFFVHMDLDEATYAYHRQAYGRLEFQAISRPLFDQYEVSIDVHGMEK